MRNIKLTLEYDGTSYAGWQSQTNAIAIQDVVCDAIAKMAEEKVTLIGASRTDAGVHALGQVATFQTSNSISCDGFLKGLNSLLTDDIRVKVCEEVPLDFHPIRNAKRKTYEYLLEIGEGASALWRHRAWWVGPNLDIQAMEEGSYYLIGEHDFKSFQGAQSEAKTTVREIFSIQFQKEEKFLHLKFIGNGFLKQMIRNMVGTLVDIGFKKYPPQKLKTILEAKDRRQAGPTAPPQGLYLIQIDY